MSLRIPAEIIMSLDWLREILQNPSDVAAITGVIGLLGGGLYKVMRSMRSNDLAHIDAKLDGVSKAVEENTTLTRKTSEQLTRHLEWHIEDRK